VAQRRDDLHGCVFVAYATFLPFSAYAYHALCVITCAVLHRTRRFPRE
jgi:hypothetical protein